GKTFKAIQSANEPTTLPDHDFPVGSKQKLIPSVYLLIDPNNTNDTLRSSQLSIYICLQYEIETSAMTHMSDLQSLVNNSHFDNRLKVDNKIRPIWVLTVDGSQSAYNPVERSMAPLSNRLAGIVLPVDHYGFHLNSQDPIFGKPVITEYVDIENISFPNVEFPGLENNIDNYNCNNITCCLPKQCNEASDLLATNNGFLPPLVMGKDSHYVNSIHLLEYYDKGKIPGYDEHCPFITKDKYTKLSCPVCKKYFSTALMVVTHEKNQHPRLVKHGRPKKKYNQNCNHKKTEN
ncbi:1590_t:CDS:2, partial [Cetraspora pellucida]